MSKTKTSEETIYFEDSNFRSLKRFLQKEKFHAYVLVCDENTLRHCLPLLIRKVPALKEAEVIEVESGEGSKAIEIATHIWRTLADLQADRSTLIVNLGGGMVTDLGGFCASLFKRGIPFIHLPTSLLAMADASIGGKTAIDLDHLKNLVGTFAHARAVFIAPQFLATLPEEHIRNGMAEIYKMALIKDKVLWKKLGNLSTVDLIKKAVTYKRQVVKKDPTDKGIRKILNFGHTLGHAIEGLFLAKDTPVLHGEAIVAGMIMEAYISFIRRLITKKEYEEIKNKLSQEFPLISIDSLDYKEIRNALGNDKKNTRGSMRFSLISGIGSCLWDQKIEWPACEKALNEYKQLSHA